MRAIGFLLLALGIGIGAIWPWAQLNIFVDELTRLEFDQPNSTSAQVRSVKLNKTNNPVRIRFQASYLVGAKLPPVKIPVKIEINDREGILLSGVISFPTKGIETGPEQGKVRGSTALKFDVLNEGDHRISLALAPNPNNGGILVPDIASVEAVIIANAPELRDDYKALAAALALAGIYLLLRSRRSKKKTPKPKEPHHWGRG